MSTFDPSLFLATEQEAGFDTEYALVPDGDYPAIISKEPKPRALGDGRVVVDIHYSINSLEATEATGMETPSVRQTLWLDMNEHGGLARGKGKNIQLGRLLAAVGMNDGGAFSFLALVGKPCMIKVGHKPNKDGDQENVVKMVTSL